MQSFTAATQQMIDHFDTALTAFESDVREGKANVRVVSNHGKPTSSGGRGGGGAIDWPSLAALAALAAAASMRRRLTGASAPAPDF